MSSTMSAAPPPPPPPPPPPSSSRTNTSSGSNVRGSTMPGTSDADVILPPPTLLNPVPSLVAALRIDNREQMLDLLTSSPGKQLLAFETPHLRTLLLRQVLVDPHAPASTKTKRPTFWDAQESFPSLRGLSVVGTTLLWDRPKASAASPLTHPFLESTWEQQERFKQQQQEATVSTNPFDDVDVSLPNSGGPASASAGNPSTPSGAAAMFRNDWETTCANANVVTYFLRPSNLESTTQVVQRIKNSKQGRIHHRIVYIPQATAMCHKILSNNGIPTLPNVSLHRLQLDIFPLESDVLSLEYDVGSSVLRESIVEQTPSTCITTVARALVKIQDVVGVIPRVSSLGPLGEDVVRKMYTLRLEEYLHKEVTLDNGMNPAEALGDEDEDPMISAMLVLDRKLDLVTPMLTPLTYEGLLDDVLGINAGFLQIPLGTIQPPDEEDDGQKLDTKQKPPSSNLDPNEIVSFGLLGSDSLYAEVRDQHVEQFGTFLQNQAKALQQSHKHFTNKETRKDLDEIHQFVKQIPVFTKNLKSLSHHIHLAQLVKAETTLEEEFRNRWQTERSMVEGETCLDILEDLIALQAPPLRVLRLLVLQSLCSGGIKSAKYDSLRRDIVQTYGFPYLFFLTHLERAGLIRRRDWMDGPSPFASLRKSLTLIQGDVDPVDPKDISYVSSGYAPLSVRLMQTTTSPATWTGKEDLLRELPGRLIHVQQTTPPQDFKTAQADFATSSSSTTLHQWAQLQQKRLGGGNAASLSSTQAMKKKPVLLIVYVGGITYMEIASLRFLNKLATFPYRLLILTTQVLNGTSLLECLA